MASKGRPTKYPSGAMDFKGIYLPEHLVEHAEDVGEGNLSEGVRLCIERDLEDEANVNREE